MEFSALCFREKSISLEVKRTSQALLTTMQIKVKKEESQRGRERERRRSAGGS